MMIRTKNPENELKEGEFFANPFLFSYSSLNTLLTAPSAFYAQYVLGKKDDSFHKHLIEGSVIHYLVLEHQGFDKKFLITGNLPSPNTIDVVTRIYKDFYVTSENKEAVLTDFLDEIDDVLSEINLHQAIKDRTKRLEKITGSGGEEYFEFLKKRENRIVIDSAVLDVCTERADIVKANQEIRELLGMDRISDGRSFGVYNELPISIPAEVLGFPFGLKGVLDNVVVDVRNKLIRINDFKTTGKNLIDFKESIEFWNYWLQAIVYENLIKYFFRKFFTKEWKIEIRFIVFDRFNHLYPFEVSSETLSVWRERFDKALIEAKYHYETHNFELPYDFALGKIKL